MSAVDLRRELAWAGELTFLNYAATAPMLASSAEAMARVAREGTRPLAEHFESWMALVEAARREAAEAIGARSDEITFTTNTSTALSLIAAAVRWREGDRVLYPADEFPSNRFVWDNLRALGVASEAVPPAVGVSFAEQLAARDLSSVRLVAVSHVSYRDGHVHDVAAISQVCRPRGILLAVDGIQAVGAIPSDARVLGSDFVACGGQKWLLGPMGSAFLYVARERLEELHVPTVGWASSRYAGDHDAPTFAWTEGAARFEGGLPDVAAIAGLGASIRRLRETGWNAVFDQVAAHRRTLVDGLDARGMTRVGPDGARGSGIVTFVPPEGAGEAIASALERARVLVTPRHGAIRVSAHATTSDEEVAAFFAALDSVRGGRIPARNDSRSRPEAPAAPPEPATRDSARGPWRRAIITGASRGLGAALARALASRGCDVTLLGRDAGALEELRDDLARRHGAIPTVAALDLADPAAVARWIESRREEIAGLDLLINNAAWAQASPFLDSEPGDERAAFEVNALAPMSLARAALPGMIARGRGHVLNVVTSGARNALPLFASYAASKAALWAWSESLSRELEGTGVVVTSFVPPQMDTATRRQLGRRAIGFYGTGSGTRRGKVASPDRVAEEALEAAEAGRSVAASARVRWETALNALAPERMRARIRRSWRGVARPRR